MKPIKNEFSLLISITVLLALGTLFSCRIPQSKDSPSSLAASFSYAPASPVAGQAVQFTDTSTGSPTSWQWSFGDGTTNNAKDPSHTYATVSSYTVTLAVSNSTGSDSTSRSINVLPAATLTASFTYAPASPVVGQAVQFTDTSTGSPTSWQWNFGDGSTSTTKNPSHTYSAEGSYLVTLTVSAGSNSNSASKTITIGNANIITAASPSLADISAAIAAANPGGTIIVPAGTATWNDHLVITKPVQLIGAGIGQTVITSNYTAPNLSITPASGNTPTQVKENYLVSYMPAASANDSFRISGFTFDCASKCEGIFLSNYVVSPWITNVRIDHNYIKDVKLAGSDAPSYEQGTGWNMVIYGNVAGVADSNTFMTGTIGVYAMNAGNWTNDTYQPGSAKNFYFEDNNITLVHSTIGQVVLTSGMGGRWCFRHNTVNATGCPYGIWPYLDAHGNMGTGGNYSNMGFEAYNNTLTLASYNTRFCDQRGGRGMFYNNNVTTTGNVEIHVREEFSDSQNPPVTAPDGEHQYVCNSYYWGNTKNASTRVDPVAAETIDYGGSTGVVPRANVHYWFQGATFNGTSGVGVGLKSARPSSGLTAGVGYWATDENILYRATGATTWEAYYTQYTYPHPLRGTTSGTDQTKR
jgi:PKD repeat protein